MRPRQVHGPKAAVTSMKVWIIPEIYMGTETPSHRVCALIAIAVELV